MLSDQDLLQAVKEQAGEEFLFYGELAREHSAGIAQLALQRATNELVVLTVSATATPDGDVDLAVDVLTELDGAISEIGTLCDFCGSGLRPHGRFCPNCGRDVSAQVNAPEADAAEMRAIVQDAITGDYEFLGEMRRKGRGKRVYFVGEKSSGRITALSLRQGAAEGEFELAETDIFEHSGTAG